MRQSAARLALVVAGVAAGLIAAELALQAASAFHRTRLDRRARARLAEVDVFRILCVGESTTRGLGGDAWPEMLEARLRERHGGAVDVVNLGVPGVHSAGIAARMESWLELYRPAVVVTMVGINDDLNLLVYDDPVDRRHTPLDRFRLYRLARMTWRSATATEPASGHLEPEPDPDRHQSPEPTAPTPIPEPAVPGLDTSLAPAVQIAWLQRELATADDPLPLLLALRRWYHATSDMDREVAVLRRLVELDTAPRAVGHALDLAALLRNEYLDEPAAEVVYERALELDPTSREALIRLGDLRRRRSPAEGEPLLARAFELYPTYHLSGPWLAQVQGAAGRMAEAEATLVRAEAAFEAALRRTPRDRDVWEQLVLFHRLQGRRQEEAAALERGLTAFPGDLTLLRDLGDLRFDLGEYDAAIAVFERIAGLPGMRGRGPAGADPERRAISLMLEHKGAGKIAEFLEATGRHLPPVNPFTRVNYLEIADRIRRHGAVHVAVQYPTLPVESLMATLDFRPEIRYVDNRERFAEALAERPYDELFTDRFAGGFGHLTADGNRMLADNVLHVLDPILH